MQDSTILTLIDSIGNAPLMAVIAFILWKIEKRITIMQVKIEYITGMRSREDAQHALDRLGAKQDDTI